MLQSHAAIRPIARPLALAKSQSNLVSDRSALLGSPQNYPIGEIVATLAEGFRYQVVETDAHLVTQGGVLLKVLPDTGDSAAITPKRLQKE